MSLRRKLSLVILLVMIMGLSLSTVVGYYRHRERDLSQMSLISSQTGAVVEDVVRHDMIESDFERIQSAFDSISSDPRIQSLYMLDPEGKIIFAPQQENVGRLLSGQEEGCQPCHRLPASERPAGIVVSSESGANVFRSMQPIENGRECTPCHDPQQQILGLLLMDLSMQPVEEAIASSLREDLMWWIGTTMIVVLLVNFALDRMVLGRLRRIAQALARFGNVDSLPFLPEKPGDEIGRLSATFNAMVRRARRHEQENRALSESLSEKMRERNRLLRSLITAQEEERKRLARELHDEFGQGLSSAGLSIEIALKTGDRDPSGARQQLQQAQTFIAEATDRMYYLILGLRPSVLDDLGLIAALKAHCQRTLEGAGIAFTLHTEGLEERLPPEIETVLFRVSQEALANVVRHSRATRVEIRLDSSNNTVQAEIRDNGIGFSAEGIFEADSQLQALGLLGMRERVEQCGGDLDIDARPDAGTRIRIRIPLGEGVEHPPGVE